MRKEQKILATMRDIQRYRILEDVIKKRLKGVEAAEVLGLHPVHISRLKKKLSSGGFESLLRKPPKEPPNQKQEIRDRHLFFLYLLWSTARPKL